jgi:hypothetical protein
MVISKTWSELKQLSVDKAIMIKYNESFTDYRIYIVESGITYSTNLIKNGDNDVTDFENNYKNKVNFPDYSSMTLPWNEFKIYADIQTLSNRLFYRGDGVNIAYYIWTNLEGVFIQCYLVKNSSDQTDFETNYKGKCNKPSLIIPTLSNYDDKSFYQKGFLYSVPGGADVYKSEKFNKDVLVFGGIYSINGNICFGDFLEVSVTDEDNILGYGAGFVLSKIIDTHYLIGNGMVCYREGIIKRQETGMVLPSYFYLTFHYKSMGISPENDLKIALDYEVW